jgi:hypothetical protein
MTPWPRQRRRWLEPRHRNGDPGVADDAQKSTDRGGHPEKPVALRRQPARQEPERNHPPNDIRTLTGVSDHTPEPAARTASRGGLGTRFQVASEEGVALDVVWCGEVKVDSERSPIIPARGPLDSRIVRPENR